VNFTLFIVVWRLRYLCQHCEVRKYSRGDFVVAAVEGDHMGLGTDNFLVEEF
jgi:hypothetical protein